MVAEANDTLFSAQLPLPWQTDVWQSLVKQHRENKMAHAYLVYGEQGIGKYPLIFAFANYMLCVDPDDLRACGNCVNCLLGITGHHPDVLSIQPEAGSRDIKIDQIRALTEFVSKTSHSGLMKVIIVNQAHRLNNSAANSLLKTLEEPSTNTYLFLITERADSLSATLRSRCQRLLLRTPAQAEATQWLQEQGVKPDQATRLALAAGMRPLHALAMGESNGMDNADEFMRSLLAVRQHRTPLQTAVATALKIGDAIAVECLLRTSSIVSKSLLSNSNESDELLAGLVRAFSDVADPVKLMRQLLLFNLEAEKALRQLQSGTNPNPQLLLESLLWQWSQLGTSNAADGTLLSTG